MKASEYIAFIIDRLPNGYVFTYADFITNVNWKEAVIKALNRMVASGKIAKLSKGKYYKPETTPFGNLIPDQKQVVKDLLEENGKITGYLTGYSIYSQLGLTTQISNTIQIGKNEIRPNFKRVPYTISLQRGYVLITMVVNPSEKRVSQPHLPSPSSLPLTLQLNPPIQLRT